MVGAFFFVRDAGELELEIWLLVEGNAIGIHQLCRSEEQPCWNDVGKRWDMCSRTRGCCQSFVPDLIMNANTCTKIMTARERPPVNQGVFT